MAAAFGTAVWRHHRAVGFDHAPLEAPVPLDVAPTRVYTNPE